jgi:hypothetical protein
MPNKMCPSVDLLGERRLQRALAHALLLTQQDMSLLFQKSYGISYVRYFYKWTFTLLRGRKPRIITE